MRARLALLATALALPVTLAAPAEASDHCVRRAIRLFGSYVIVCVGDFGCTVYQTSGSPLHEQEPICL